VTRILQHFIDPSEPPIGLWWENDTGGVDTLYRPGLDAEKQHATVVMSLKYPKSTWDEFFDALEQIPPVISGWESVETNLSPEEYLQLVTDLGKRVAA